MHQCFQGIEKECTGNKWVKKQPQDVLYKKDVLKSFSKFTEKHLHQSLFLNFYHFTVFWCFHEAEKGCIENESVNPFQVNIWLFNLVFDFILMLTIIGSETLQ